MSNSELEGIPKNMKKVHHVGNLIRQNNEFNSTPGNEKRWSQNINFR